ncbi:MAG TPA: GntR family transcriptional regulator [Anaerolineae bacterium]|jgi:DNA-binding GntR family transcriptional regulator|nr:GntR family transcriptional regulator [Anaerolineae bacterium]
MKKPRSAALLDRAASIDRTSYEPAYIQLVNILRHSVASGVFRPGDQLPSEAQLCERYSVSPMTVRRAINMLADQGVISTAQGRGCFVKPVELGAATFHLAALQDLFSDKETTTVKLLETRILSADERIARKLAIAVGDRTVYIRRLLSTDGVPAFYHREYLIYDPKRPIVEAEMEVTALHGLFSGTGETILKRGDLSLEAAILTDDEARLLKATSPTAAFCIEHLFYDFDDCPISWGWFICPSDRLRFNTQVGISGSITARSGVQEK